MWSGVLFNLGRSSFEDNLCIFPATAMALIALYPRNTVPWLFEQEYLPLYSESVSGVKIFFAICTMMILHMV